MPCFHPITAFKSVSKNQFGKNWIKFKHFHPSLTITIPCGQCIGCRLESSRQWAVRGYHEAQTHENNSFLTLTYDNDSLPGDASLNKRHFQLFLKRLRKYTDPIKIRYIHCGEYGDQFGRPHYHAILFGYDFPDKIIIKKTDNGSLYKSEILEDIWGLGNCSIGDVTFDSIAYVARYILKKQTGAPAEEHYRTFDPETGEITHRQPEYITMSRRPGIGKPWLERYQTDVYPHDYVVINGRKCKPPKYYDSQFSIHDEQEMDMIKLDRKLKCSARNITPQQLNAKKVIVTQKTNQLKRKL